MSQYDQNPTDKIKLLIYNFAMNPIQTPYKINSYNLITMIRHNSNVARESKILFVARVKYKNRS
jgi:hypothetical protein